jgi:phosphoribosylformylglycinamidine synthase
VALDGPPDHAALLSELPGRVVVATPAPGELLAQAALAGVPAAVLGQVGGDRLRIGEVVDVGLPALRHAAGRAGEAIEAPSAFA